jgi:hypothetical protein
MRSWPALIVAPMLALFSIGFGYALVTPACEHARPWLLHASTLFFLALCLATTLAAWLVLRTARREMMPLVSMWSGAFFSLVILTQWVSLFVLSPCMHSP